MPLSSLLIVALFSSLPASSSAVPSEESARPYLRWIDVGQGSALLAVGSEGQVVMVDSGPAGAAESIIAALGQAGVRTIDLWIHTHYDADHIGGFARVLAGEDARWPSEDDFEVRELWDRGSDDRPSSFAARSYWALAGARRRLPLPGESWSGGGIEVRNLGRGEGETENERGLALCLTIEGRTLLIAGDLPAAFLSELASGCDSVDLWWVGHHGAADGVSGELLEALRAPIGDHHRGMG